MILLYMVWGKTLRENATSELQADCDNLSTLLDTQMDQMNQLSKRIVSSKQLKSLFLQDLYSDDLTVYNRRTAYSDALFDIIKLSFDNMELNMFDTSGRYIHVGMTNTFKMIDPDALSEVSWVSPTLEAYGKMMILPSHLPEFNPSDTPVVSLARSFSPDGFNSNKETAILELQFQYSYLSHKIQNAIHNQSDKKKILIYDRNGKCIYPYNTSIQKETPDFIMDTIQTPAYSDAPVISRTADKSPTLFAYKNSPFTNWTVFVTASEKNLLSSFYLFRTVIIAVSFIILLLTLSITYQIAAKLSTPLKKLEQSARSLTLDNLSTFDMPIYKSNFKELDSLSHSFEQMQINLQNSLQNVVAAHTMATDAKMLALQSQMNPHFLYNTLASISVLAEDGENNKIVEMCNDLALLLRYIASGAAMNVDLRQEIEHTRSYIQLIKVKYEERIQFHVDINESLFSLKVPKLILQPLVENCVKYALNVEPPWIISIDGFTQNGEWRLRITDNGSGFSEEYLEQFYSQTLQIDSDKPLPDLSINGMGLLNLYTRLFLRYKDCMIFKLENMEKGGACVTIGGPLSEGSSAALPD
ncbi:MAG: histidine kinase [Lachnospiraceae bacterium]|nr:histidine kinase [Lachnospiraceae bacterium]